LEIIFHLRKATIAADFKKIATEKINSLQRLHVKVDRIEVEVIHQGNPSQGKRSHTVIITSHGAGPLLRAEAAAFNDLAAFDEAIRKVELQLRKRHERAADHKRESVRLIPVDPDLL
jgi:ribosomal subunit interface protein